MNNQVWGNYAALSPGELYSTGMVVKKGVGVRETSGKILDTHAVRAGIEATQAPRTEASVSWTILNFSLLSIHIFSTILHKRTPSHLINPPQDKMQSVMSSRMAVVRPATLSSTRVSRKARSVVRAEQPTKDQGEAPVAAAPAPQVAATVPTPTPAPKMPTFGGRL